MMEEMATDEFIMEHAITNGGQKKQACYASFRKIQHKITDTGTAESSTMITSSSSTITTTTNSNNNGSKKRAYNSLEQEAGEEEEEEKDDQEITVPSAPKMPARGARITIEVGQKKQTCYAAYRKIQHNGTGKATAERGLMHDFKHELHYVLSTLFDEKSSVNLKSLSLSQLLRKSTSYEFREFLRSQSTHLNKLFVVLAELVTSSPVISLSTACLLFFMARDRKGVPLSEQVIRLLSEQLKQQPDQQQRMKADDEYTKHHKLIWSIVLDWLRNVQCRKIPNSQFKFDMFTEQQLSVPYLTLEALCYMAIKEHSQLFKTEMLSSGCLSSVVAKLDKVVLELLLSPQPKETGTRLKMVERCYRILENAAAFNAKNQTFLIQHRNNLLIFSSAKFFNFALKFAEDANSSSSSAEDKQQSAAKSTTTEASSSFSQQQQAECNKLYDCICLVCRVLMNVSHDNENAALKIGQVAGFLANCLYLLAQHFKYAPREKHFDLAVMMYGLLVNLLERCAANRRKFISLKSNFFETDGSVTNEVSSLEILAKLFVRHDSAAKTVDEELDNDLAVEEPEEGNGGEGSGGGNGLQQQERAANVSQDEVVSAIQNLMSKASTHMEDSMIASYCALVVAILVGTDHNLAGQITAILPDNDMSPMLEQLERFLEFMRITKMKAITVNNIERVLRSFQMASSANSSSTS